MAQPEIEVNQITAAPAFDGTNITNVDAISLNGVADTGYAKLASSNTFTADQTINTGAQSFLNVTGSTLAVVRLQNTSGTATWRITAFLDNLAIADQGGDVALEIEDGTLGRPRLLITNTDVKFDNKALNRANVITASSSFTLNLTHTSAYIRVDATVSNRVVTVPTNASVPFSIGTQIDIHHAGGFTVSVAAAGGVTINTPETLTLRKPQSTATLIKVATDVWDLVGDLAFV